MVEEITDNVVKSNQGCEGEKHWDPLHRVWKCIIDLTKKDKANNH